MKKLTLIVMSGLILAGMPKLSFGAHNEGSVQVTVVDADGAVMADAVPLYIYGEGKTKFTGGKEIPGRAVVSLKEGDYRLSAVLSRQNGEYVDRFTSNEAQVHVVAGDNISVILTLQPIENRFVALSYSEMAPADSSL